MASAILALGLLHMASDCQVPDADQERFRSASRALSCRDQNLPRNRGSLTRMLSLCPPR
jgi:hypothetical protein